MEAGPDRGGQLARNFPTSGSFRLAKLTSIDGNGP
jgi:hypothetical protein